MNISLCIATYRRPQRLAWLLDDLRHQTLLPDEVIVVDNDADASAHAAVEAFREAGAPFAVLYDLQPVKNISLTRNRCVELAAGEWVVFVDDDERAPPQWLQRLVGAAHHFRADGVLGPVEPLLPTSAPSWIRRGRFYDWARMPSGTVVPRNRLRFGNVMLSAQRLREEYGPFDPAYGLTGGEDGDLLSRMAAHGSKLVWCDEAVVHEPVEPERLSLRWLMRRALRGGQDFARHSLNGRYGPDTRWRRMTLLVRAIAQMLAAGMLSILCLPFGRHHAAHWMTRASANLGKLSVFWGWHYREYA